MQKITPFLWFNNNAEEAVNFYLSVFPDSKIISKMPGPGGKVMGLTFELLGQRFFSLNGGPTYANFTEAISFFVDCDTQEEVDNYWDKLIADGGQESKCGWLKDKYGLSWQIIPKSLGEMLGSSDREKAGRAIQVMLKMNKIDIKTLKQAFDKE
jgi:predicted 3-demethylubiquinone-9 3-methyltransferase (glyoxalase superfamily)